MAWKWFVSAGTMTEDAGKLVFDATSVPDDVKRVWGFKSQDDGLPEFFKINITRDTLPEPTLTPTPSNTDLDTGEELTINIDNYDPENDYIIDTGVLELVSFSGGVLKVKYGLYGVDSSTQIVVKAIRQNYNPSPTAKLTVTLTKTDVSGGVTVRQDIRDKTSASDKEVVSEYGLRTVIDNLSKLAIKSFTTDDVNKKYIIELEDGTKYTADYKGGVIVTSVRDSASAEDTVIPSEKAVRTELDKKHTAVTGAKLVKEFKSDSTEHSITIVYEDNTETTIDLDDIVVDIHADDALYHSGTLKLRDQNSNELISISINNVDTIENDKANKKLIFTKADGTTKTEIAYADLIDLVTTVNANPTAASTTQAATEAAVSAAVKANKDKLVKSYTKDDTNSKYIIELNDGTKLEVAFNEIDPVTAVRDSSTATNDDIPSELAVRTELDKKVDKTVIKTDINDSDDELATSKAVKTALNTKVDKVTGAKLVKDFTADTTEHTLTITFADDTKKTIDLDDVVVDIYVKDGTYNNGTLKLKDEDGNELVSVDINNIKTVENDAANKKLVFTSSDGTSKTEIAWIDIIAHIESVRASDAAEDNIFPSEKAVRTAIDNAAERTVKSYSKDDVAMQYIITLANDTELKVGYPPMRGDVRDTDNASNTEFVSEKAVADQVKALSDKDIKEFKRDDTNGDLIIVFNDDTELTVDLELVVENIRGIDNAENDKVPTELAAAIGDYKARYRFKNVYEFPDDLPTDECKAEVEYAWVDKAKGGKHRGFYMRTNGQTAWMYVYDKNIVEYDDDTKSAKLVMNNSNVLEWKGDLPQARTFYPMYHNATQGFKKVAITGENTISGTNGHVNLAPVFYFTNNGVKKANMRPLPSDGSQDHLIGHTFMVFNDGLTFNTVVSFIDGCNCLQAGGDIRLSGYMDGYTFMWMARDEVAIVGKNYINTTTGMVPSVYNVLRHSSWTETLYLPLDGIVKEVTKNKEWMQQKMSAGTFVWRKGASWNQTGWFARRAWKNYLKAYNNSNGVWLGKRDWIISFWVQPENLDQNYFLGSFSTSDSNNDCLVVGWRTTDKFWVSFENGHNNGGYVSLDQSKFTSAPHHICLLHDTSDLKTRVYVDGVYKGNISSYDAQYNGYLTIVGGSVNGTMYSNATLSEIRVYVPVSGNNANGMEDGAQRGAWAKRLYEAGYINFKYGTRAYGLTPQLG